MKDIEKPTILSKGSSTLTQNNQIKPLSKKRTDAPERLPRAITAVVNTHTADVQNCYRKAKRHSSTLKGNLKVLFVINPAGSIIGVKFVNSDWTDKKLGLDVEECISNHVKTWKFAAIDDGEGNVTASTSYTFE